jgi:RNA polymerase sigma factor (sigma-70 family)
MSQTLERFHLYLQKYENLVTTNAGNFVDDQWVEDVTQETFIRLYEHLDSLKDEKVMDWLVVVSGNIAKDYIKKGGKRKAESVEMDCLEGFMKEHALSAEETFEIEEKQKAGRNLLRTACELLYEKNPIWYYVMIDACMFGMSSAQIADVLDIKAGHVDVIKTRARKYLRKVLGKEIQDYF